jgi:hypothetical protein
VLITTLGLLVDPSPWIQEPLIYHLVEAFLAELFTSCSWMPQAEKMPSSLPRCYQVSAVSATGTPCCLQYVQASQPVIVMTPLLAVALAMQICDRSDAADDYQGYGDWTLESTCGVSVLHWTV